MSLNCYKVMREIDGKLYSTNVESYIIQDDFVLEYKTGKLIKPKVKGTSLYVFKTYEAAKKFASQRPTYLGQRYEVWSCTVNNPTAIVLSDYIGDIPEFWKRKLAKKRYSEYKRPISGYMTKGACVTSLRLIERIS